MPLCNGRTGREFLWEDCFCTALVQTRPPPASWLARRSPPASWYPLRKTARILDEKSQKTGWGGARRTVFVARWAVSRRRPHVHMRTNAARSMVVYPLYHLGSRARKREREKRKTPLTSNGHQENSRARKQLAQSRRRVAQAYRMCLAIQGRTAGDGQRSKASDGSLRLRVRARHRRQGLPRHVCTRSVSVSPLVRTAGHGAPAPGYLRNVDDALTKRLDCSSYDSSKSAHQRTPRCSAPIRQRGIKRQWV